ncbi:alpha/beta fold hydrolase [Nonomuraea sp. NPDC048826]|uniref:alpha/beta fold hydrolase n=1 Tax=Nonomuraea sp. NPDC048826 TaxID=3364347 RepID=UPI0037209A57
MPKVFVHGFPETAAVWGPLLAELERAGLDRADLIRLSPPGFGAPVPAGFDCTVTAYRDWLIDELAGFTEPVDLVGHDWGGVHAVNAVISRPGLVRSWVSDVIGLFDPEYGWHGIARKLQAPDATEAAALAPFGPTDEVRVATFVKLGMGDQVARQVVEGQDETMGRASLALYRSAAQPVMAELGRRLEDAARRPGLALLATEDDVVGTPEQRRRSAERAGARVETLEGLGHWWLTQDPERAARRLTDFWADVQAAGGQSSR